MALTWIKKSDRYCWNNFSQSFNYHPIQAQRNRQPRTRTMPRNSLNHSLK